jgi:hypothetical protein
MEKGRNRILKLWIVAENDISRCGEASNQLLNAIPVFTSSRKFFLFQYGADTIGLRDLQH